MLKNILNKYREFLLYIFFGGLAFFISIGTFIFFTDYLGINALFGNVLSWIVTVLFAFLSNKKWVFNIKIVSKIVFLKQMSCFFAGRILTLLVEEFILYIGIVVLLNSNLSIKVVAQIIVILLNYFISKFWVFKN